MLTKLLKTDISHCLSTKSNQDYCNDHYNANDRMIAGEENSFEMMLEQ